MRPTIIPELFCLSSDFSEEARNLEDPFQLKGIDIIAVYHCLRTETRVRLIVGGMKPAAALEWLGRGARNNCEK